MADPYLYLIYPIYLIILIGVSIFLGWVGRESSFLRHGRGFIGHLPITLAAISIFIYILRLSWVNIKEFNSLYASNTMLAVNDQLIWYMSRTGRSFSPMYGVNYFFGHFKPILYLFALFYKIRPGPETLLFVQILLLGAGAIPVYLIAAKKVRERVYGLIFTLAYLFTMTLISYTSFHTNIIAIPFLIWAIYFIERGSAKVSFLFIALAMSCQEDISLLVFFLGLYIFFFRKDLKIRKFVGYSFIIFSLLCFYLTIYIIGPVLGSESNTGFLKEVNATYYYLDPGALLKSLFSFEKVLYLFFLLLPFGFLPLFSPLTLVALPEILINIFSSKPAQVRIFNYYSAIPMAIFLVASLEVVSKRKSLSLYLLSCAFFTLLFFGPSPEYRADRHSLIGKNFLKAIPKDASVYSQVGMASHLSQREGLNIYLADYNYSRNKKFNLRDYEYAMLDLKGDKFPDTNPSGEVYFARLKELIDQEEMGLVKREDGFLLLKRHSPFNKLMTWRGVFIEGEPITSPVLYAGRDIGLIKADFPCHSKQGDLFWLELRLVKLKEVSKTKVMLIEFRGKRQSFAITPLVAHGILDPSYWREGEILRHIETIRFSPFLWPGIYEIFFSFEKDQGGSEKPTLKIGEVLVKRRNCFPNNFSF